MKPPKMRTKIATAGVNYNKHQRVDDDERPQPVRLSFFHVYAPVRTRLTRLIMIVVLIIFTFMISVPAMKQMQEWTKQKQSIWQDAKDMSLGLSALASEP